MEKKKNDYISYLKGISIISIVLFHLINSFSTLPNSVKIISNFGGAGVHIFFMCSGFGLYYSYLNKPVSYSTFLKKRMSKIYIPYIILVIVSFFVPFMIAEGDRIKALFSHIFLYKMFIPKYNESFGSHLWFISTIIQMYLIFFVLIKMKNKIGSRNFIIVSCTLSVAWWIIVGVMNLSSERVWNSFFLQYLWEFAIGMCIAERYKKDNKLFVEDIKTVYLLIITLCSGIVFALMSISNERLKTFNDVFSVMAFGGAITLIYRLKIFNKWFEWVNKFSYELYLVHILVMMTCARLIDSVPNICMCVIAFVLSLLFGYAYNYIIKKMFSISKYWNGKNK